MKYKIGNVVKVKDNNNEIINGKFLIIKSRIEKPTEKIIMELTSNHNILNLTEFLKNAKISIKDYIVVQILPSPYPKEVGNPNLLSVTENQITLE